jgi:hypothetical protein
MKFTENHLYRGLEFWKTVLFAFGSDGHNYVCGENLGKYYEKKKKIFIH